MSKFKSQDTISGKEGKAFTDINGLVEELFMIKSLEATLSKNKSEVKVVGKRGTGHKTTGFSGAGTLTIFYMTSKFRTMVKDYIKTGIDTYFDITVINEDPASEADKQTIVLKNCNIDSVMAAKLDGDSDDSLDEELPFTFEDMDILDEFTEIS